MIAALTFHMNCQSRYIDELFINKRLPFSVLIPFFSSAIAITPSAIFIYSTFENPSSLTGNASIYVASVAIISAVINKLHQGYSLYQYSWLISRKSLLTRKWSTEIHMSFENNLKIAQGEEKNIFKVARRTISDGMDNIPNESETVFIQSHLISKKGSERISLFIEKKYPEWKVKEIKALNPIRKYFQMFMLITTFRKKMKVRDIYSIELTRVDKEHAMA